MKLIILFVLSFSLFIYSQQIPTTLSESSKDSVKFDFSQNSGRIAGQWFGGQSMPIPRYYGASVMYSKNDTTWLYVFGGDTTSLGDATNACLRYNVNMDSWEYIDTLPAPLRVNSAARLGDKLYTMGGFDSRPPAAATKKFYEYDINSNIWTELPELPESIYFHKAVGYQDSLIYIIGGVNSDSSNFLSRVILFNTISREYRDATPLPEQRANFGVAILNNNIFMTGGFYSNDSLSDKTIIASIDPVDHALLNYSFGVDSTSNYPIQVQSHFGYPKGNDKIVFFGGSSSFGFSPVKSSFALKLPETVFDTVSVDIPINITAFYAGYSYSSINPGIDSALTVVFAGGVTLGPSITGECWVYKDTILTTSISETGENVLTGFSLKQNYPNPFNPSTIIEFEIPEQSFVKLEIYNPIGENISTIVSEELAAGSYSYKWHASGLSSGVYFYRLTANGRLSNSGFKQTKKLLLMK